MSSLVIMVVLIHILSTSATSVTDPLSPDTVHIAALLPSDNSRLFSSGRIQPAESFALDAARNLSQLPVPLSVSYRNSGCSEVFGMKEAISLYIRGEVNVFFGPVCDYAVAPVARQVTFWDIPLVTLGGVDRDFKNRRQDVYPLLTRAGPVNLQCLVDSFLRLFKDRKWKKVKVLYEPKGQSDLVNRFCHLLSGVLVYGLPEGGVHTDYYKMKEEGEGEGAEEFERVLLDEIGHDFGGELFPFTIVTPGR